MGTSKGYIAPTRPEWSKAKRAVSTYLKNGDSDSRANAVAKYAEAMRFGNAGSGGSPSYGSSFSSAAGNVLSFARGIAENGLDDTLIQFGRSDLIGKSADTIIHELLTQFTNHNATIEDSLASEALSTAFDVLGVESPEDMAKIDLDAFLLELIIAFVNNNFDFRFYEKVSRGRTPENTRTILQDVHEYIDGTLRSNLSTTEIDKIDLSRMGADSIVSTMLDDAFSTCMTFYGVEA